MNKLTWRTPKDSQASRFDRLYYTTLFERNSATHSIDEISRCYDLRGEYSHKCGCSDAALRRLSRDC